MGCCHCCACSWGCFGFFLLSFLSCGFLEFFAFSSNGWWCLEEIGKWEDGLLLRFWWSPVFSELYPLRILFCIVLFCLVCLLSWILEIACRRFVCWKWGSFVLVVVIGWCLEGVLLEVFDVVEKARCGEEWVSFVLEGWVGWKQLDAMKNRGVLYFGGLSNVGWGSVHWSSSSSCGGEKKKQIDRSRRQQKRYHRWWERERESGEGGEMGESRCA